MNEAKYTREPRGTLKEGEAKEKRRIILHMHRERGIPPEQIALDVGVDLDEVLAAITGERATVYDIDVERTKATGGKYPAAVIVLQMDRSNASHSGMLSTIAELPCVHTIHELIA